MTRGKLTIPDCKTLAIVAMDNTTLSDWVQHEYFNRYKRSPAVLVRAPGRVTLLGAHVDYSEGRVLPAAIEQSVWLAAGPSDFQSITLYSREYDQQATFRLEELLAPASQPWLKYPMGVAWALRQQGCEVTGLNGVLASEIPVGAGLSSSAAVEIAMVLAWESLSAFELSGLARAQVGQTAENQFLGVGSGIMDQFVCVHGEKHHLILLDCRSLESEPVPIDVNAAVLLADSGVRRDLAAIDYNARPRECAEAVNILKNHLPQIQTLRDVSLQQFRQFEHRLPPLLRRRAEHVITECARVLQGAQLLRRGDIANFGRLVRESQVSSRDNYENSTPELNLLAETAWNVPGCYGARFSGAGFGGMVQVLAEKSALLGIKQALSEAFIARFDRNPGFVSSTFAGGAQCFRL